MLHEQAACVRAVATGVPPEWSGASQLALNRDRLFHVCPLGRLVHELVTDPAQAVTGNFMPELAISRDGLRMTLQGAGHAEDCQRQLAPLECTQHAPQACARAVFEERFHAEMAHGKRLRVHDLREKSLRGGITVK